MSIGHRNIGLKEVILSLSRSQEIATALLGEAMFGFLSELVIKVLRDC